MQDAIEKFALFGGVSWEKMDLSLDSMSLIERYMLPDFSYIRNDINELTTGLPLHHSILTGVAQGDGRTHTAFKRANVGADVGMRAVEELVESGILRITKPIFLGDAWKKSETLSNRLSFASPFLRFWFAFVSPIFKGVRDGDYGEIRTLFANREQEFLQPLFVALSHELLKESFADDTIERIQNYWDEKSEIDIFAKTASGKVIVGLCKYTNAKLKKSELSRLQKLCADAAIEADIFVLVSKSGFSSELKALKGENLRLFTLKHFVKLVE